MRRTTRRGPKSRLCLPVGSFGRSPDPGKDFPGVSGGDGWRRQRRGKSRGKQRQLLFSICLLSFEFLSCLTRAQLPLPKIPKGFFCRPRARLFSTILLVKVNKGGRVLTVAEHGGTCKENPPRKNVLRRIVCDDTRTRRDCGLSERRSCRSLAVSGAWMRGVKSYQQAAVMKSKKSGMKREGSPYDPYKRKARGKENNPGFNSLVC